MNAQSIEDLKGVIREIPDWPKEGILFYDVTTLLKQGACYEKTIQAMLEPYKESRIDLVLGMEARGFIFAPTVAYALNAGFIPVRKPGKLPAPTFHENYELEYGTDRLEIHQDAIKPGERVLIVDDLIATGGTAEATAKLAEKMGAEVVGFSFAIELTFLNGKERLSKYNVHSVLKY